MLLKKLTFYNFRQFKGKQEVEFSCEDERNVTILLGKNTGGKTTFVQAFKWVLYDDSNFTDSGKRSQILNSDVSMEMRSGETASASVELILVHRGVTYTVSRYQNYKSKESGSAYPDNSSVLKVLYLAPDGITKRIEERDMDKINSIMPRELSEYFFFDGERIRKVTDRGNVESAVNSIMGLTPITNMKNHVTKARNKFRDRLIDDGSGKVDALSRRRANYEKEIKEIEAKNEAISYEIQFWKGSIQELDKNIGMNKSVIDDAKKRKELEADLINRKRMADDFLMQVINKFTKCIPDVFLYPMIKETVSILDEGDLSNKGIPDMNSSALDYIIKRGTCICGKDIRDDEESIRHIKELYQYLPPAAIGTEIHNLSNDLVNIKADAYDKVQEIEREFENYLLVEKDVQRIQTELENISMRLENTPDVEDLESQRKSITENLRKAESIKRQNDVSVEVLRRSLQDCESELKSINSKSEINARTQLLIEYSGRIIERCERIYSLKSEDNLKKIRETIEEVFSKMYHGDRTVEIDDRYTVKLSSGNNRSLDASTGLDTVKNFAFVASLLKMAKDSMVDDESGISSEPYPLVMDAPFSNTDEIHISNISAQIPKLAQQAIIALMDKDWKHASATLDPYVGAKYRFNKKSETYTEIIKEA